MIGLGYVGLPLAIEFGRRFDVVGFDISETRVGELRAGADRTGEVPAEALSAPPRRVTFTSAPAELAGCDVFIVTVPTPIDVHRVPNLTPLLDAMRTVGRALAPGSIVINESTVYPGATEERCVPILEHESGLTYKSDFAVGYSPERVNPGDPEHRIPDIPKVTAGSTPDAAAFVDRLYATILRAETHRASSIAVAEAAKVIENTQRDVNIALVNELAMLFKRLDLDTSDVLAAAATKWNFLPFRPGLVGGHCIGVDSYYLTYKAQAVDHHPEMILAGRRTNDQMGGYVADRVMKLMTAKRIHVVGARILVLGATFKENCPDARNSQVRSLVRGLQAYHAEVDVHDPWADARELAAEFRLEPVADPPTGTYDAVVLAVPHRAYLRMGATGIRRFARDPAVVFDVKAALDKEAADERL